jgi:hypothetical protein
MEIEGFELKYNSLSCLSVRLLTMSTKVQQKAEEMRRYIMNYPWNWYSKQTLAWLAGGDMTY